MTHIHQEASNQEHNPDPGTGSAEDTAKVNGTEEPASIDPKQASKCWFRRCLRSFSCCSHVRKNKSGGRSDATTVIHPKTRLCAYQPGGRLEVLTVDWSAEDRQLVKNSVRTHALVAGLSGLILGMVLMSMLMPSMPRVINILPAPVIQSDVENTPLVQPRGFQDTPPLRMQGLPQHAMPSTRPGLQ